MIFVIFENKKYSKAKLVSINIMLYVIIEHGIPTANTYQPNLPQYVQFGKSVNILDQNKH